MQQAEFDAWIALVFGVDPAKYGKAPSGGGSAAPAPVHMRNANERHHDGDDDAPRGKAETVKGDKISYQSTGSLAKDVRNLVHSVSEQARINALAYAAAISAACADFKSYSAKGIKELKGTDESVGEIIGSLAVIVSGGIEVVLAEKVAEGVGREMVKVFMDVAKDRIVGGAKKVAKSDDIDDLDTAVDDWMAAARDMGTIAAARAEALIVTPLSKIETKIAGGDATNPAEDRYLMQFMDLTVPEIDQRLAKYGVPDAGQAKKTQLKIYGDLVARFEESVLKSKTPGGEKISWVISGVPTYIHKQARATAHGAVQEKEKQLDTAAAAHPAGG